MVAVERAQPGHIRPVAFQGDAHALGQALDGDFLFQAVE